MDRVRVVVVDAVPAPGTDAFDAFNGATINVYTTEQDEDRALDIAGREVAEAGWHAQSIEDSCLLTRADLAGSPEGLTYFEQTLVDGVVLVIHGWRLGDEDVAH